VFSGHGLKAVQQLLLAMAVPYSDDVSLMPVCVSVCVKAREEYDAKKKHFAELQVQASALQATGSQMKTKASELTSAMVNNCISLERNVLMCGSSSVT